MRNMKIKRFIINLSPHADFVAVSATFFYVEPSGTEHVDLTSTYPSDPFTIYVSRPNIIDRFFNLGWQRKIDKAKGVLTARAEKRMKHEREAEQLVQNLH